MSLSEALEPKIATFKAKVKRLPIVFVDTASPEGLAVCISGDLDTDSSYDFQAFMLEILREIKPASCLILDLSGLTYISSTGVGSLTTILSETRKHKIKLHICGVPKHIWNIIDLLGFTAFFSFIDSYQACP